MLVDTHGEPIDSGGDQYRHVLDARGFALKDAPVVWEPLPKQSAFLTCSDYEVLFGGSAGGGKALALGTPIPTPTGWTTMGELQVGDLIFGEHGQPVAVARAFDVIAEPESFRITFDDGSTMDACANHKWLTFDAFELGQLTRLDPVWREKRRAKRPSRAKGTRSAKFTADLAARNSANPPQTLDAPTGTVRRTAEIFATLRTAAGRVNHAVPVAGALQLPEATLPLDPYCLGVWLGDGDSRRGYLTTMDPEILAEFAACGFPAEQQKAPMHYRLVGLGAPLKALDLICNKHVPAAYLRGSAEQRLALLQGLMDSDGTVTDNGSAEFTNTNPALAEAVLELVVSLGWKARMVEGRATLYGKDCGPKYDIKWTPDQTVFRLPRKRDLQRLATRRTTRFRYIVDCQPIDSVPMRCISVDSPAGLFLAGRQMVVTHNSDSLLIDGWCIQDGGPTNRNQRAIVFRRTYPELQDLIGRSHEIFPAFIPGIEWNGKDKMWTAPSGATFAFGYLQNDNDRFKYRGRAWNWIGFDELTLWSSDVCYLYLMSRNRRTDMRLPRYMRATTNPDGPGQKWVMERWGIEEEGDAARVVKEMEFEEPIPGGDPDSDSGYRMVKGHLARTFIPARLSDNRYLRGTGYRETLMELPDDEQAQLLRGKWTGNNVRGAYYLAQMQRMRASGRITTVPHVPGVPTNTFWDLGKNDTTAIWLHQQMGLTHRFPHAFENSGEYLPYYVARLQELQAKWDISYGTHYLPHDAAHDNIRGKPAVQQLRELWPGQTFTVVPKINRLIDGINRTRAAMAGVWIDRKECSDAIAALDAYRKKWDKTLGAYTNEHVHDRFSNFADAFRMFAEGYGPVQHQHVSSSTPEWQKRLQGMKSSGRSRSPMAS